MASTAPPPLKKRRRDEPPTGPGLGSLALDLSEIEAAEATTQKRGEDDAEEGEWLFKQDDVVLGPVLAAVLVQRIEKGEIDGDTSVGREAGKWRPLKSVGYFKQVLDKAEARKKAIREQLARDAKLKQQRMVRWSTWAGLVCVPFLIGAVSGHQVMKSRFWDSGDEWLQRPPPLVDLPPKPPPPPPPPVQDSKPDDDGASADGSGGDDDGAQVASADDKPSGKRTGGKKRGQKKKPDKRDQQVAAKADADKPAAEGGKTLETLTQTQVMAPVRGAQGAIGKCLKTEVARNPDMPSRVTLMWTVTENGTAVNFKLKEREVRTGPLSSCLTKIFAGMRWPKFTGERKNVELPLGVKK